MNHQNKVKSIVFGYIREHESTDDAINIPPLVSYKCLKYYCSDEYFSRALEDFFTISNDKMTITNIRNIPVHAHTIYCNKWIESLSNVIVKWTFSIKSLPGYAIFFGLTSNEKRIDEDFCTQNNAPCYQVSSDGIKYSHNMRNNGISYPILPIDGWDNNDTLTFILDLTNKLGFRFGQFSIKKNDKEPKMIFNDVEKGKDIKYKMTLQMINENSCVVLKQFIILQK